MSNTELSLNTSIDGTKDEHESQYQSHQQLMAEEEINRKQ